MPDFSNYPAFTFGSVTVDGSGTGGIPSPPQMLMGMVVR